MSRRFLLAVLCGICCSCALAAADAPLKVFASTYPVQLFARNLMKGSPIQPELLLPANLGCPHDYVVTPAELRKISIPNVVLLANGLGLDNSICNALRKANPALRVFYLAGSGTELAEKPDHDHDHAGKDEKHVHAHHHDHGHDGNPHWFASPFRLRPMLEALCSELCRLDSANAALYRQNLADYLKRLDALCADLKAGSATLKDRSVAVQHDVFEFLVEDLNMKVAAVIQVEPGENPSAAGMIALIRSIRSARAFAILAEPQYSADIASTIGRESRIQVIMIDPVANGALNPALDYYEQVMRRNLELLRKGAGAVK